MKGLKYRPIHLRRPPPKGRYAKFSVSSLGGGPSSRHLSTSNSSGLVQVWGALHQTKMLPYCSLNITVHFLRFLFTSALSVHFQQTHRGSMQSMPSARLFLNSGNSLPSSPVSIRQAVAGCPRKQQLQAAGCQFQAPHAESTRVKQLLPVYVPDRDEEVTARSNSVAGYGVLLDGPPDEHGGLGVQPHGLTDDPGGVGHGLHLLQGGNAIPNHRVHLHVTTYCFTAQLT